MKRDDFHMTFRECVSLSLLFAALEKTYPHSHNAAGFLPVEGGGKETREKVFRTLKAFSTSFPQLPVDAES